MDCWRMWVISINHAVLSKITQKIIRFRRFRFIYGPHLGSHFVATNSVCRFHIGFLSFSVCCAFLFAQMSMMLLFDFLNVEGSNWFLVRIWHGHDVPIVPFIHTKQYSLIRSLYLHVVSPHARAFVWIDAIKCRKWSLKRFAFMEIESIFAVVVGVAVCRCFCRLPFASAFADATVDDVTATALVFSIEILGWIRSKHLSTWQLHK